MKRIIYMFQLSLLLLLSVNCSWAIEVDQDNLYQDKDVATFFGEKISKEGTLVELLKQNKINFPLISPFFEKEIFKALKLDENKLSVIESSSINGFSVNRYHFSKSFDLIITAYVLSPENGKLKSANLSFVPHMKTKYLNYLLDPQKHKKLLFFRKNLWKIVDRQSMKK